MPKMPKSPKPPTPKRISAEEVDLMLALLNLWCEQEQPDVPRQPGSGLIH